MGNESLELRLQALITGMHACWEAALPAFSAALHPISMSAGFG
jgi:hypothetical protein